MHGPADQLHLPTGPRFALVLDAGGFTGQPAPAVHQGQTNRLNLVDPMFPGACMIKVAIVEDNRFVREGLTLKLNEQPDITVCHAAADGDLEGLRDALPQVLLLDVGLEGEDSLHLAERMRTELPVVRVIIMDLLPVHEDLVEYVTAGVSGFILKDATLDDLVVTIQSVAGGGIILPPQMTATLFSQIVEDAVVRGLEGVMEATDLTPRERKVVSLIGDGLSNKAIARHLDISPHTVKSHVRNVMDKLALHSRLQISSYLHRVSEHANAG